MCYLLLWLWLIPNRQTHIPNQSRYNTRLRYLFYLMIRRPPRSTPFPSTTLFRPPASSPGAGVSSHLCSPCHPHPRTSSQHCDPWDRQCTRLYSSHSVFSFPFFCFLLPFHFFPSCLLFFFFLFSFSYSFFFFFLSFYFPTTSILIIRDDTL